jgi:predicted small lipoprotein YifL
MMASDQTIQTSKEEQKRMKKVIAALMIAIMSVMVAGCGNLPTSAQDAIQDANQKKQENVKNLMQQDSVQIDQSIERKNIAQRITVTNRPDQVSWIYLMGDDATIVSRLPLRGKATSGNKRLTSDEMKITCDGGEYSQDCFIKAPDDMGTYGSSGDYVFFFTPNGMLVQWSGHYLMTSEPYMLNPQTKQIEYTVDTTEMAKVAAYKEQIKNTPLDKAKGGQ